MELGMSEHPMWILSYLGYGIRRVWNGMGHREFEVGLGIWGAEGLEWDYGVTGGLGWGWGRQSIPDGFSVIWGMVGQELRILVVTKGLGRVWGGVRGAQRIPHGF